MKYAIRYSKNFKYLDLLDEVIIEYGENSNEDIFKELLENDTLDKKRIIIKIRDVAFYEKNITTELIKALKFNKPELQIAISFPHLIEMKTRSALKKVGVDYFYSVCAGDWETFHGLVSEGVSDIYITYSLGFDLEAIGALAVEKGISIRAFANVAQSSWPGSDDLKSFFVHPAAVPIYENYIDVLEFYGDLFPQQLETLYKIYAIDRHWFGDLKEIIISLETNLDERGLVPSFAISRTNCQRKCLRGGLCRICERAVELSNTLVKNNYFLKEN